MGRKLGARPTLMQTDNVKGLRDALYAINKRTSQNWKKMQNNFLGRGNMHNTFIPLSEIEKMIFTKDKTFIYKKDGTKLGFDGVLWEIGFEEVLAWEEENAKEK